MTWLLAIMLAQAYPGWIRFEVCQLDFLEVPPVAAPQRDKHTILIRRGNIDAIAPIRPKPTGIECTQISSSSGYTIYVIGTEAEVIKKLTGQ